MVDHLGARGGQSSQRCRELQEKYDRLVNVLDTRSGTTDDMPTVVDKKEKREKQVGPNRRR